MAESDHIPINSCSLLEIATVPGMTTAGLAVIAETRTHDGVITPDLFASVPSLGSVQVERFDFSIPAVPTTATSGDTPPQPAESSAGFLTIPEPNPVVANTPSGSSNQHALPLDLHSPPEHTRGGRLSSFNSAIAADVLQASVRQSSFLRRDNPFSGDNFGSMQSSSVPQNERPDLPPVEDFPHYANSGHSPPYLDVQAVPSSAPVFGRMPQPASARLRSRAGIFFQELPKGLSFDGNTKWDPFFRKFTLLAADQEWDGQESLAYLCWCLEGKALAYYDRLAAQNPAMDFTVAIRKMAARFNFSELPESSQLKFMAAKQEASESLEEWVDRLQDLAVRAFPGSPESFLQQQLVLRMCQGAYDHNAGYQALNHRPKSVESAAEAIRWAQHSHNAVFGRSKPARVAATRAGNPCKRMVNQVHPIPSYPQSNTGNALPKSTCTGTRTNQFNPIGMGNLVERLDGYEGRLDVISSSVAKLCESIKAMKTCLSGDHSLRNKTPSVSFLDLEGNDVGSGMMAESRPRNRSANLGQE
ncbi:uncharacterized protein LOC121419807 [Lytechinus variegatus]|uniref:uncharacterized protein LOC121419807 n=1 Tax=Lytechinus variegatus TaxID=7654 RepID=UPI001BB1B416|nr:uncharacterized protein LOC121419807 [Lytechinus variegatus]